jgi:pyridoxal phosphate enzyme (YggS family)
MKQLQFEKIRDRYNLILDRIAKAAIKAHRNPDNIKVVIVTKGHSSEIVEAVLACGALRLGENYVEEAIPKINQFSNREAEWHMIGHIQSRKARFVCENFSYVHSLDRKKIALRLDRCMAKTGRRLPVLLECNASGEESKYGFPAWNYDRQAALVDEIGQILALPNLEVRGLMTMPPWDPDPETSRPFYKRLIQIQELFRENFPQTKLGELSMGMSNDYEVAIQEGATFVRIGTAIVGPRI